MLGLRGLGICIYLFLRGPGHPFDLTKTRLQTAQAGAYTGALDVVRKALARDGVTGYVPCFVDDICSCSIAVVQGFIEAWSLHCSA